jgi:hypothetical protein
MENTSFDPYDARRLLLEQQLRDELRLLQEIEQSLLVETRPLEREQLRLQSVSVRQRYEAHLAEYQALAKNTPGLSTPAVKAEEQPQPEVRPARPQEDNAMPSPLHIFVSYARADSRWLKELQTHLAPLTDAGKVDAWDDTHIPVGALWNDAIKTALAAADIAVLLVTPAFLASRYIVRNELPVLLKDKKLIWIAVSATNYEVTDLARFNAANDPTRPLDSLKGANRNREWVAICKKILKAASPP